MTQTIKLAVIPGDGIGKEVVPEGLKVLERALEGTGVTVRPTTFDLGAERWHRTGQTLTDEDLEAIKTHDAILLGAVGDPSVPSGVLERGLLLRLRFALDHYVNLRPSVYYPGVPTPLADPGDIDFVVVREGTAHEIATEVSVNTAYGVERLVRYAFAKAQARAAKHLTLVHKHNVLVHAGDLWRRTVEAVGTEYPEVAVDYCHVDAATIYMVTDPGRFDVIVTDNLFGDILTDEAGAVTGGIGLSASGNINPERAFPSMFEPVHGSAPDIAGQGKADPTATISAVALMLDHLELHEAAAKVEAGVTADMATRRGGAQRSTSQIGDAIAEAVTAGVDTSSL